MFYTKNFKETTALLIFGFVFPILGSVITQVFFHEWKFPHVDGHALIEWAGGIIAIVIVILLQLKQVITHIDERETQWITAALLSMGTLDILHAIEPPGERFVWFHSMATFLGGLFFMGVAVPKLTARPLPVLSIALGVTFLFVIGSYLSPLSVPSMLAAGEFTPLARLLNIGGGLGFLVSSIYLFNKFRANQYREYYLLSAHCLLFGMAGVLFELSAVWDGAWWWWHILRLAAYLVLVAFFLQGAYLKIQQGLLMPYANSKIKYGLFNVRLVLAARILCAAVVLVTVSVMVGWLQNIPQLIQVMPHFVPMQFNTALGLLLSAISILFIALELRKPAAVVAAMVVLLGTLTLLQYMTGMNFGIDELFMTHYITVETSHPGRMAPNTAFCFILIGLVGVLNLFKGEAKELSQIFLSLLVFGLSCVALLGYAIDLESAYGWGNFSRMAVHTAMCFNVLAISNLIYIFYKEFRHTSPLSIWATIFLFTTVVLIDLALPSGYAIGIAYIPLICCSFWFERKYMPFVFAAVASVLITLGHFSASPEVGLEAKTILVDRVLVLISIWIVATLIHFQQFTNTLLSDLSAQLKMILQNAGEGVFGIDQKGRISFCNQAAEQLLGYQSSQLLGAYQHALIQPYYQDGAPYPKEASIVHNTLTDGQLRKSDTEYFWRNNGSTIAVDMTCSPIFDERYGITGAVVIFQDITDRKQAESEKEYLIEKLSESNRELERFAYVASHDLQEPLRMISGFSQLLSKRYADKLDAEGQKFIEISQESALRMQALIDDLLEYSRITEEGEIHQEINCNDTIGFVKENLQEAILKTNAKITSDNLPIIFGNPIRFARVLQNLIGNALKYQKSDNQPQVHVGVSETANAWLFCVSDNGIGMNPEYCEQIFLPFKRLHNKNEYAGTGIGLAICRKILEQMDGKIWAESEPDKGTRFYFTVPKRDVSSPEPQEQAVA